MDTQRTLIARWDSQRATQRDIRASGLNRLAAEGVRHAGPNRFRLFQRAGIPIAADESNDLLTATRDLLVDDIEDAYLPLTIVAGDQVSDTHIPLWRVDQAHYEFFVPDDYGPLSADDITAIESTTNYRIDASGTYGYYLGADRIFMVSLSAESLMVWARQMLCRTARGRCNLTRRLNVPSSAQGWPEAHGALSGVALGYATPTRLALRTAAPA
jgi:hypothetical protein